MGNPDEINWFTQVLASPKPADVGVEAEAEGCRGRRQKTPRGVEAAGEASGSGGTALA